MHFLRAKNYFIEKYGFSKIKIVQWLRFLNINVKKLLQVNINIYLK